MKPRLLVALLVCAMLLAGCYRQTEEPFQQIDSAEVVEVATPAVVVADSEVSGDTEDSSGEGDGSASTATRRQYITPETVPGQIEQPTVALPTSEQESTAPSRTLTPFVFPSPTLSFEEQLDPADECVYQVQAGNVLFRLALAWDTTYQEIMDVNQLESENLSIGQLLLIPGCESSEPEATLAQAPESAGSAEEQSETTGTTEPKIAIEAEPTATARPEIHVVSAGETIESISLRYRVDVNELIALNEIANPNRLSVGQELKLPQ